MAVGSGDGALDAAEREPFDIVFMDVDKSSVDGLWAVKMLRYQELGRRHTTVVGVTSHEETSVAERCREAGCDAVLLQPFDARKVLALVTESLPVPSDFPFPFPGEDDPIRSIAAHPRFRTGLGPPIADNTFPYLLSIGGLPFVNEVTQLFIADSAMTLGKLSEALESNEYDAFRNGVVSLGESAAILGASRLAELCRTAALADKDRLTLSDRALAASLRSEVARVVAAIGEHAARVDMTTQPPSDDVMPGEP